MFFSYIVHDVVEIEPVYLPNLVSTSALRTTDDHNNEEAVVEVQGSRKVSPTRKGASDAAATAKAADPSRRRRPASLVKTLFGSEGRLRAFLDEQVSHSNLSGAHPDDGTDHSHHSNNDGNATTSHGGDDAYAATITDALIHRLTEKYVGKVLPGCGLCVAIRSLLESSGAEIRGPSASAWVGVVFEACVLAPSAGARLRATVIGHSRQGLHASLMSFLDGVMSIIVPAAELNTGACYDAMAGLWFLPIDGDEEEGEGEGSMPPAVKKEEEEDGYGLNGSGSSSGHRNYYTVGDTVLLRVVSSSVMDEQAMQGAAAQHEQQQTTTTTFDGGDAAVVVNGGDVGALIEVVGSFVGEGLGPMVWFDDEEEEGDNTAV